MEYVNDIYPCICIRITTFHTTRIRTYICHAHMSLGATQSETEHSMGGCFK